jgi:hypothetical protein
MNYVRHFNFRGVSVSGGEPLMTFDKTLDFISTVRKNSDDGLHIWMYTNGTLMTASHILRLKDAGLNEIRFDIGASDYDLKQLRLAVGHIPVVTVEIPAVPEDMDRLSALVPVMAEAGVDYLNLHQLRLTPHNRVHLKARNYTFLHGEKVTVLESELAVLHLFGTAIDKNWSLPINYCAFTYKNQFQQAAARRRSAGFILKPFESITENGFIRSLHVKGGSDPIGRLAESLTLHDPSKTLFQMNADRSRLFFHASLWPAIDFTNLEVFVDYYEAILRPDLSYRYAFKEVRLDRGMKLFVEKQNRCTKMQLSPNPPCDFEKQVILKEVDLRENHPVAPWMPYECIGEGLQAYF